MNSVYVRKWWSFIMSLILLKKLEETTKNLIQKGWYYGQDSNQTFVERKAGALSLREPAR